MENFPADNPGKHLIVLTGPTASGKTAAGIRLAQAFDTEIISADSRQFYREMTIGTAVPATEELSRVKHHFIHSHSIFDELNVGSYERLAISLIDELFKTKDVLILLGGSGLYIRGVCEGLDDLPESDKEIRRMLTDKLQKEGIESLQEMLLKADPELYKQMDLQNPHRLIRAIEVCITSGESFSDLRNKAKKKRNFHIHKIGLELPREQLYKQIDQRVDDMLASGLMDEVKNLYAFRHLPPLQTVGYTEYFNYFEGRLSSDEATELVKRNTRRFAKRQLTWFRRDKDIKWFHPEDFESMKDWLLKKISESEG